MSTTAKLNVATMLHNASTPGACLPGFTVYQPDGAKVFANELEITGPCRLVHRPHAPLPCGAITWLETEAGVRAALPA
jgi:hypothetical protein